MTKAKKSGGGERFGSSDVQEAKGHEFKPHCPPPSNEASFKKPFLNIVFFYCLFIYSYVHTLFGPFLSPAPCPLPLLHTLLPSRQNLFCPLLQFC
jgi:hypothetical protein